MPLRECISRTTHREYEAWQIWLDEQWNQPSLNDYYLMQIAAEVRRILSKHPNRVKLGDFKIPFVWKKQITASVSREQQASRAKSRWFGFLGIGK